MNWLCHAAFALGAYLLGSVPFAYLFARLNGVDIRKVGSGNVGATNVFRAVGKGWGIATFAADALKGFVPAWLFPLLARRWGVECGPELGLLCGCAAIAGHSWPVFLRFKGGKGVATSAGMLLGVAPAAVGIGLAVWVAVFVIARYVSVASIAAAFAVPAAAWGLYGRAGALLPGVLTVLGALVIWRHRSNLARLRRGEEHRWGRPRSGAAHP
ncbi:MAG TPA: glycerol-3-phosphate 1-O-acyltransferase PlsY [Kiritimatiellia bacterium]|nr:glycerol-3-phosphate 1-O-acyltransferase PlsY [Kiritimatiellia bacterium]HRZ11527.1 glycerol-3-phosphate 1-O-acyltransferase PlsY [Kiritimatiellia bacterium]HSA16922.1 glycerol-3-phosphate 1-O-acyltransferase PlsY [Kiritimatiellia bacterium]